MGMTRGGGSQHVEVGGARIAYERAGSGPPVILLHGAFGDSREWSPQLESLSAGFDVVAWDAPGWGRSPDAPEDIGLHGYADALAAFIGALGLDRPHVVGLSFGSGLALELYRRHPRIPRTLGLVSAYAGWAGSLPPAAVAQRLERALRDADRPPAEVASEYAAELFAGPVAPERRHEFLAMMAGFRPAGLRALARAFAAADLRPVLPEIAVPVLLLYGGSDVRSPIALGEALHAAIPHSRLVVMPGVGHQCNFEAPERFDAELRAFLREPGA